MASKKAATAPKTAKKTKALALPAGFRAARTRLDGFFEREAGNSVTGILRGAFKVQGKWGEKTVFRIEVTDGETQCGEGEMVGPGGVVGLDETGYTSALADVESGTAVYVRYEGLEDASAPAAKSNPHVFAVGIAE
jgi:hypothetical protein